MSNPLGLSTPMNGQVLSYGAQGTVEANSASNVVAGVAGLNIAATGAKPVTSVQPTYAGVYRLSGYLVTNNGTSPSAVTIAVTFNDGVSKASETTYMSLSTGTALNANSTANGAYPLESMVVFADSSAPIAVTYTGANTPNDHVTIVIEQLA